MLVQMLTERVANGGSYNLTFGESLTMAGIGMLVVFMELIILALIIMLMGKVVSSIGTSSSLPFFITFFLRVYQACQKSPMRPRISGMQ